MRPSSLTLIPVLLLLLAAAAITMDLTRAPGTLPPMFSEKLTFEEAEARAEETGKPVFAVFSATWCATCRTYKSAALSDPRVEKLVKERFIPAYVDVDQQRDAARRFKVSSIPSTGVFKRGERRLGSIGIKTADELLTWLEEAEKKAAN